MDFTFIKYSSQGSLTVKKRTVGKLSFLLKTKGIYQQQVLLFCGFPGYKPVPPGWFKIVCWFYVDNTQRLTESGFMEKPGIEPATPGLQGIALIPYTTAASQQQVLLGGL